MSELVPPAAGMYALQHVVHHHAVGAEPPAERADGALHARDPVARQPVVIAVVVERDDLDRGARGRARRRRGDRAASIEVCVSPSPIGEAVEPVVRLGPPAVEHRQVQAAVQHDLLAAGAARFERPPRVVQPDVDALHQVAADVDVVVLDERRSCRQSARRASGARSAAASACRARRAGAPCPRRRSGAARCGSLTSDAMASRSCRIRFARL